MNKFQITVINQAQDEPEVLTDWEVDFISDMADKDEDYQITPKQNAIINRIAQKVDQ